MATIGAKLRTTSATAVDTILRGRAPQVQVRRRLPDGSLDIEVKQMAMDERNQAQGFGRSNGSRGEREEGFAPRERRSERGGRSSDRSPSLQPITSRQSLSAIRPLAMRS